MTSMMQSLIPVPTSVSEAARQALAAPPPPRPRYPPQDDTAAWLQLIDETDAFIRSLFAGVTLPVTTETQEIAGIRTYIARPEGVLDSGQTRVYLNFHGGALIFGGGEICQFWNSENALMTGMISWGVDYRMPPLHPFPAALDDCLAVYRALLELRAPADIVVGGWSAGGNLAAALLVRAKDEGVPMPAALVLREPAVDLTESGDTYETLKHVGNAAMTSVQEVSVLYAGGHDLAQPYLSPLFADVSGFPPTFLQSGTRDQLLSNTVRMHRKLRAAGVAAELHVFEAMPHGGFGGMTPEDLELQAELRGFLNRNCRSR